MKKIFIIEEDGLIIREVGAGDNVPGSRHGYIR